MMSIRWKRLGGRQGNSRPASSLALLALQLRLVAAEVRAVEVVEGPVPRLPATSRSRSRPFRTRPAQHHLAEALVKLVVLKSSGSGSAEQLGREERLVYEQPLAAAVPADEEFGG
ncbi:hypothetical protein P7K49_036193 [Saguinus oedipus]|uniref:Uncharacterized protein n=1 Tax=Saguinus oedipus TaxID=9490 RepID=A0ABQ9TKF2_SAGOE|nr:hypothetical protein P7K49_036193 [Saguinus oedipus]